MAATHGLGTYGNGVGTVTPEDHKLALAGLVTKRSGNLIRSGVFWGGVADLVVGKANMSYDVLPFTAALSRGASDGAVLLANDGTVNVPTTAAPGSNSRIDVIYVWQREYALDGTNSEPMIGVVQGTPAASPAVPSLAAFPGAIALAQVRVPAGVTATSTGTTFTQVAPFTAAAGGVVVFRTKAEADANVLPKGTQAVVLADMSKWASNGTAWVTETALFVPTVSGSGVSVSTDGVVSFASATVVSVTSLTSDFRVFEVDYSSKGTASNVMLTLLTTGGAEITSQYDRTEMIARNSTVSSSTTGGGSSWSINGLSNVHHQGKITLVDLAHATETTGLAFAGVHADPVAVSATNGFIQSYLSHREAVAYGGFRLSFSAAQSGTLRIRGIK